MTVQDLINKLNEFDKEAIALFSEDCDYLTEKTITDGIDMAKYRDEETVEMGACEDKDYKYAHFDTVEHRAKDETLEYEKIKAVVIY